MLSQTAGRERRLADDRRRHRSGAPAFGGRKRGSRSNALGRSRGGLSIKIHVIAEAHGLLSPVHLTPGRTADIAAAEELIELVEARPREMPADKGHDADDLQAELLICGVRPVVLWRSSRRERGHLDQGRPVLRNWIERMIGFPKQLRRLATRHNKTAGSFLSFARLAAIHRWMRFIHATCLVALQHAC